MAVETKWVKNLETGLVWHLEAARADYLLKDRDAYEEVEEPGTEKPKKKEQKGE